MTLNGEQLFNNFNVVFRFEGKARAEREEEKGALEQLCCPGVTLLRPHFLPGLSLQNNCFLL